MAPPQALHPSTEFLAPEFTMGTTMVTTRMAATMPVITRMVATTSAITTIVDTMMMANTTEAMGESNSVLINIDNHTFNILMDFMFF